jgi:hypothetical protein
MLKGCLYRYFFANKNLKKPENKQIILSVDDSQKIPQILNELLKNLQGKEMEIRIVINGKEKEKILKKEEDSENLKELFLFLESCKNLA